MGSLGIKLLSGVLVLGSTILLARVLGPSAFGVYSFVYALAFLLMVPGELGLPQLVVRETARLRAGEHWALLGGLWRWSAMLSTALCLLVTLIAGLGGWLLAARLGVMELATLGWGLLLVPLMVLSKLTGAGLRGLQRVLQGQLPELVIRQTVLLVLVAAVLVFPVVSLTADLAMALHVAGGVTALTLGTWWLLRHRPPMLPAKPELEYDSARWFASAWPLALVASMHMLLQHTDLVMLGWFSTSENVGIYRVAVQGAAIVGFGLNAMNMVVAPEFARLYAGGDFARLQRTVTNCARVVLLLTLPIVVLLALFAGPVIVLVFGAEYSAGQFPLALLAAGQLGNALFGSVGFLLNMTGHERDAARGLVIAAVVNVMLNLALIPALGVNGAALATAFSLIMWNVLLWRAVRIRLGIDSTALGLRPTQRWW